LYSSIKKIPERLEIFDEVDLIRESIAHNNRLDSKSSVKALSQIGEQVNELDDRTIYFGYIDYHNLVLIFYLVPK
jgi:hypothetical protein